MARRPCRRPPTRRSWHPLLPLLGRDRVYERRSDSLCADGSQYLDRLLAQEGDAFAACRRAVMAGAAIRVWAVDTPAVEVAGIYARRLRLLERRGIPQIGFADAVRTLTERRSRGHPHR